MIYLREREKNNRKAFFLWVHKLIGMSSQLIQIKKIITMKNYWFHNDDHFTAEKILFENIQIHFPLYSNCIHSKTLFTFYSMKFGFNFVFLFVLLLQLRLQQPSHPVSKRRRGAHGAPIIKHCFIGQKKRITTIGRHLFYRFVELRWWAQKTTTKATFSIQQKNISQK